MGTNETATILSIFFPVSKQPIFERNKRIIQVIIILSLNTKTTKPLRANKENNRGKHFPKQIQAAFFANFQFSTGCTIHSGRHDGKAK